MFGLTRHADEELALLPSLEHAIDGDFLRFRQAQIEPWALLPSSGVSVKRFDDGPISYEGIHFPGSPEHVFWARYVEPFLEEIVVRTIASATTQARARQQDVGELLARLEPLLVTRCASIFSRIADIDFSLHRQAGEPRQGLRNVDGEVARMREFVHRHVAATTRIWQDEKALRRRSANIKWLAGVAAVVVAALVGTLAKRLDGG